MVTSYVIFARDTVNPERRLYKWNRRYKQNGIEGLSERSRRPHNHHLPDVGNILILLPDIPLQSSVFLQSAGLLR